MRRIALAMLAAAALWGPANAAEKDTRTPLEAYEGAVTYGRLMCSIAFKMAQTQSEIRAAGGDAGESKSGDYRTCITTQKAEIKRAYDRALRTVGKPAAKLALKEHYIGALSLVNGIEPKLEERVIDYRRRQSDNEAKVDDLWTRFETEK